MSVDIPSAWIDLAHRMADAGRAQSLPRFRARIPVDDKDPGRFDPVTQADRDAEAAMRALLDAELPEHGIIGEEHGISERESAWTWVLDPIDGTRAFISGFPTWVSLIGLLYEGKPAFGLIDAPATGDRWASHGQDLRVRACADLSKAVISTTTAELFNTPPHAAAWKALEARSKLRRYGGDGFAYGLLAAGHVDAVVERGLQIYDVAAVIAVVEQAGGRVSGWDGGDPLRGHVCAAGDPRVHAQILEVLRATGAAGRP